MPTKILSPKQAVWHTLLLKDKENNKKQKACTTWSFAMLRYC